MEGNVIANLTDWTRRFSADTAARCVLFHFHFSKEASRTGGSVRRVSAEAHLADEAIFARFPSSRAPITTRFARRDSVT